jgi:rubredoxin
MEYQCTECGWVGRQLSEKCGVSCCPKCGVVVDYEKWENYGFANGWRELPARVVTCRELGHRCGGKEIGKCLTEYQCSLCKYRYKSDSSD